MGASVSRSLQEGVNTFITHFIMHLVFFCQYSSCEPQCVEKSNSWLLNPPCSSTSQACGLLLAAAAVFAVFCSRPARLQVSGQPTAAGCAQNALHVPPPCSACCSTQRQSMPLLPPAASPAPRRVVEACAPCMAAVNCARRKSLNAYTGAGQPCGSFRAPPQHLHAQVVCVHRPDATRGVQHRAQGSNACPPRCLF